MDKSILDRTRGRLRDTRMIEAVLARLPLFRQVPRHSIAAVASHGKALSVKRGTVLAPRGERMAGIIVFVYGTAKLTFRRHDGEEKIVRFLAAGDTFGEAAALHDRPCPVDVVALTDAMVVVVPPDPLLKLIGADPHFARNLVRSLSEKFLGLLAEFEASVQQTALQRLAHYLDTLAEPVVDANARVARLPASKTMVAARLGITKETMSRLLRELAGRGLIEVGRKEIVLRDPAALARVAR